MRIEVGERGEIELLEVYTGVVFVTAEGRRYGVAMRDLGIEITRGYKSLLVVDSLPTEAGIARHTDPLEAERDDWRRHAEDRAAALDDLIERFCTCGKHDLYAIEAHAPGFYFRVGKRAGA